MMTADDFTEHVARVRTRFASTLNDKIAASFADFDVIAGGADGSVETVIALHRRLHEMYGIALTLDFPVTGKAAGLARSAIREAAKAKRPLTPEEAAALKTALETLRAAAAEELRGFCETGESNAV